MTKRLPRHGDGTAWLIADAARNDYLCYWYTGSNDGHLVERTRLATATEAVAWGRERTARVRIRLRDAHTYWAGTGPRPAGLTLAMTWGAPTA